MRLREGLTYVPAAEVDGVDLNDGLLKTHMESDDGMTVAPNDAVGVLTSARPLEVGGIIVVYEGELREDGSADRMGYFRITRRPGGREVRLRHSGLHGRGVHAGRDPRSDRRQL